MVGAHLDMNASAVLVVPVVLLAGVLRRAFLGTLVVSLAMFYEGIGKEALLAEHFADDPQGRELRCLCPCLDSCVIWLALEHLFKDPPLLGHRLAREVPGLVAAANRSFHADL
eukprot:7391867-Prymnesium_polylepis.1